MVICYYIPDLDQKDATVRVLVVLGVGSLRGRFVVVGSVN